MYAEYVLEYIQTTQSYIGPSRLAERYAQIIDGI